MTEGKQGMMHVIIDGQRCHVSYQPVPGSNWSLAMVCPDSEVLIGYHRLAYVIVVLIFLGLFAMLWLCRRVVRKNISPINKLLEHAQKISEGHYDVVIPRSEQKDDIAQLQNSFATMQQALQDHLGSINYTKEHFQGLKIKFESELSDEVRILTNHLYLMRTIRELLYNAAKYSDGEHIRLHISQATTSIRFIVEDTGPGLPDVPDALLYKPFMKMDDLSEGLGLGLPLSKRHALSLGGDLIYDRDYKDGCRFIVEMPK